MSEEITNTLIEMLGRNAIENDMVVDKDFGSLCSAVSYLVIQLKITRQWCDEHGKEHIEDVLGSVRKILIRE